MLELSAAFTRPNDTTAYASGDLVANNTVAGSVLPLAYAPGNSIFAIRRARIRKSGVGVTNASFRVHLYAASPTAANGDNGVWSTTISQYLGFLDVTVDKAFTDGAAGNGVPTVGSEININLNNTGQQGGPLALYALLEARGAYTPAAQEVFTVALEILAKHQYA